MHPQRLLVSLLPHWLLLVSDTLAAPVSQDDVVAVGSYVREVRQPAPFSTQVATEVEDLTSASNAPESQDAKKGMKNASGKSDEGGYYRSYDGDAEGEKGYSKETYGKGDQGYKTLDTFHKQDGDKYEFETQTTYGKGRLADDNERKRHEGGEEEKAEVQEEMKTKKNKNKKNKNRDHESAGTMVDADYAGEHGDGSEYSHYSGSDDGDHYSSQYAEKEPASSTSYSENYSSGADDGDDGSYETHGSYSSSDGDGDEEGDHY